jgi:hypothetical protein
MTVGQNSIYAALSKSRALKNRCEHHGKFRKNQRKIYRPAEKCTGAKRKYGRRSDVPFTKKNWCQLHEKDGSKNVRSLTEKPAKALLLFVEDECPPTNKKCSSVLWPVTLVLDPFENVY